MTRERARVPCSKLIFMSEGSLYHKLIVRRSGSKAEGDSSLNLVSDSSLFLISPGKLSAVQTPAPAAPVGSQARG